MNMENTNEWMTPRLEELAEFIKICHDGQFRAGGEVPYFTHPIHVAHTVNVWGGSERALAVALSHDVIEDCSFNMVTRWQEQVDFLFPGEGCAIRKMVEALSVPPAGDGLNRHDRMIMAHTQVRAAEPETTLIKLADRLHNLQTIKGAKSDGFIKVYCAETEHMLHSLQNVARKNNWEGPWNTVREELTRLQSEFS
jgi:(p)ppGpp synthase/HD superfamily hydrolase